MRAEFLRGAWLASLADLCWRRPLATLAITGVLCALSLVSGLTMRFRGNVADLAPAAISKSLADLEETFGVQDQLILLLTSTSTSTSTEKDAGPALLRLARAIASALKDDAGIHSITFGWEAMEAKLLEGEFLSWAPMLTPPSMLGDLSRLLTPEGIAEAVRKHALLLDMPGLSEAERWVEKDPLELRRFPVARMLPSATGLRFRAGSRSFLSEDGKSLLVRIQGRVRSSDVEQVKVLVAGVRRAEEEARRSLVGSGPEASAGIEAISIGHTGGYQFTVENEAVLRSDLTRNISCSIILVLLVLFWGWRSPLLMLLASLPLAAAMVIGFGLFSLLRREVVSLAFISGAILAGLGIDYMIHVIEALWAKSAEITRDSVVEAVKLLATGLILAAGTTAMAFLSFVLVSGGFLRDLGLLSALGIGACLVASVSVLPALLSLWSRRRGARIGPRPSVRTSRGSIFAPGGLTSLIARGAAARPRTVLAATLISVIGGVAYIIARPPRVEEDLRRLQDPNSEAMRVGAQLSRDFGSFDEPVLLFVRGPDGDRLAATTTGAAGVGGESLMAVWKQGPEGQCLDALARLMRELEALRAEKLITGWHSALDFLPPPAEQEAVLQLLASRPAESLADSFRATLEEQGFESSNLAGALQAFRQAIGRREPLTAWRLVSLGVGEFLPELFRVREGAAFALVAVYPTGSLWSSPDKEKTFAALRQAIARSGLTGELSGILAVSEIAASAVINEFLRATAFSLVIVVALVLVLFPGLYQALASLIPVLLGCLWTAMAWDALGYRLNIMNVGILPMLLGCGVDYGIHLVARSAARREIPLAEAISDMAPAIDLTVLTTLMGFGTLAFSTSQGLTSVGVLSALGVIFCQLGTIVVLPALLSLRRF